MLFQTGLNFQLDHVTTCGQRGFLILVAFGCFFKPVLWRAFTDAAARESSVAIAIPAFVEINGKKGKKRVYNLSPIT
jgi:hypothetical protein